MTNFTRKTLLIYFAIWSVIVALAAAATFWFGPAARVPVDLAADGAVLRSRPIGALWLMPAMATLLYGSLALAGWVEARRRRRKPPVELGEDARRGLEIYGRTVRNAMVGFGLIILLVELFGIMRTGGIAAPFGLDREGLVRLFAVVTGALIAYAGNATPRLPWRSRPGLDTAACYRANRIVGWILMLGGIGYALSALTLPFVAMLRAQGLLILAMLGGSALCYVYAVAVSSRRTV